MNFILNLHLLGQYALVINQSSVFVEHLGWLFGYLWFLILWLLWWRCARLFWVCLIKVEIGAALLECLDDLIDLLPRPSRVVLILECLLQQNDSPLHLAEDVKMFSEEGTSGAKGWDHNLRIVPTLHTLFFVRISLLTHYFAPERRVLGDVFDLYRDGAGQDHIRWGLKFLRIF